MPLSSAVLSSRLDSLYPGQPRASAHYQSSLRQSLAWWGSRLWSGCWQVPVPRVVTGEGASPSKARASRNVYLSVVDPKRGRILSPGRGHPLRPGSLSFIDWQITEQLVGTYPQNLGMTLWRRSRKPLSFTSDMGAPKLWSLLTAPACTHQYRQANSHR